MGRRKPIGSGAAAAIVILLAIAGSASAQTGTELILPVTINAVPRGETAALIVGEDVFVPVSTLERAGLNAIAWQQARGDARLRNAEKTIGEELSLSLRSLAPLISFALNEQDLTLSITIDPSLLAGSSVTIQNARPADIEYSSDTSTFLNYAVTTQAFSDVHAFAEVGSSLRGNLLYSAFSSSPEEGFTRGMTNYTIDQRSRLRRITLGDAAVFGDELGGSGIVGGATVSRQFELDPYFIRFPSMSLRGLATTPSDVEIYVNGVLVDRRRVAPGPFEVGNVPAASGTAAATIVVRDAYGREQSQSSSFYYSTGVLGRGLSEYTYSAGAIRNSVGSFDYDEPLLFAAHRFGLTDNVTIGGRLEVTESVASGGPSVALASRFGEVDVKVAASNSDGKSGFAGQLGFRRLSRRTNFGGSVRVMSREYANFSLEKERERALEDVTLFGSYLPWWGGVGLQWTSARMRDTGDRKRLALLTNIGLGRRASLIVSAAAVDENGRRFGEYFTGISIQAFGDSTLNVAGHSRGGVNSVTTELQQSTPVGSGWGYRLQNTTGTGESVNHAAIQYQSGFGRYEVALDPEAANDATVSASGAVIYQSGKIMPTRPVAQSFALVRIPGIAGVRIYLSNQLIGRTDSRGELMIPNLLPYYGNRVRVDDRDIPMTHAIEIVERTIAPPARGGALVLFEVHEIRAAMGKVVIRSASQEVIPAYGELTFEMNGGTQTSPIGGQGDFFFENVAPGSYQALISYEKGTCAFTLEIPSVAGEMIELGVVVCRGATP